MHSMQTPALSLPSLIVPLLSAELNIHPLGHLVLIRANTESIVRRLLQVGSITITMTYLLT